MEKGILIISLEMPAPQILDRLVAKIGSVALRSLGEGVKTQSEIQGVKKGLTKISNGKLVIRDDIYDIASICATARAMAKSSVGLDLLFVDYLQLIRCDVGREGTREREVAEVSRALRLLSLELNCLVISITQLNEQGKARESRAIQQDATAIVTIRMEEGKENSENRTLVIPYQRNGPCGVQTNLRFNGRTASFLDID
jgi:replicative DNA helicase